MSTTLIARMCEFLRKTGWLVFVVRMGTGVNIEDWCVV